MEMDKLNWELFCFMHVFNDQILAVFHNRRTLRLNPESLDHRLRHQMKNHIINKHHCRSRTASQWITALSSACTAIQREDLHPYLPQANWPVHALQQPFVTLVLFRSSPLLFFSSPGSSLTLEQIIQILFLVDINILYWLIICAEYAQTFFKNLRKYVFT